MTAITASRPAAQVARTARFRRMAAGIALIVAPWGLLIANTGYAWATRDGGGDDTGAGALALAAAHPNLMRFALLAAMVACLLLIPAVLGAMRLLRARTPRLSLVGGSLMIAGYVCYLAILTTNFTILAMAERGGPTADYAAVVDASQSDPTTVWVFLLFVLGNLLGTLLLGLAMLRSRAVPAAAAFGVLSWPFLHITGLIAGSEWFEVTGALLQAAGFVAAGVTVLRLTDDEWDAAPQARGS